MKKDALAVMMKVPAAGEVKTRLCPPLSTKDAALLYEAFLIDLFARLEQLKKDIDIHVFYASNGTNLSGSNSSPILTSISKLYPLTPQKDGDLGDRMQAVFTDLFARGYERVAIIGSDSPDIPLVNIQRAFITIKGHCGDDAPRLVLGPAIDGGYYLIAMNSALAPSSAVLFNGVRWGTFSVLQETLALAQDNGVQVALLPQWHDIDTFSDLTYIKDSDELPATTAVINSFKY
jgi:hypothetical protein